jgi:hypothetical protein
MVAHPSLKTQNVRASFSRFSPSASQII